MPKIIAPPICADCLRLHKAIYGKWGMFCDAFPDGIPDDIIASRVDHRQPVDGDHGLQFLAKSPEAAADAARIIAEARPVINLDADSANADWLRTVAGAERKRQEAEERDKQQRKGK